MESRLITAHHASTGLTHGWRRLRVPYSPEDIVEWLYQTKNTTSIIRLGWPSTAVLSFGLTGVITPFLEQMWTIKWVESINFVSKATLIFPWSWELLALYQQDLEVGRRDGKVHMILTELTIVTMNVPPFLFLSTPLCCTPPPFSPSLFSSSSLELTPYRRPGPCSFNNGGCNQTQLCLALNSTLRRCACPDVLLANTSCVETGD